MRTNLIPCLTVLIVTCACTARANAITLESAPPVVVRTIPQAGSADVDPCLVEIEVTFSKPMLNGSWSWSTLDPNCFPETTGKPRYLADGRTCVLPVRLKPGRFYAIWLNSDKFQNFKDTRKSPAVPYLLSFQTTQKAKAITDKGVPPGDRPRQIGPASETPQLRFLAWQDQWKADPPRGVYHPVQSPSFLRTYSAGEPF